MDDHTIRRPRGRPRGFDLSEAVRTGQRLFHEHGYENVNLASLAAAIGITPPSFYAAFGSKGAFFEEALRLYAETTLPLDRMLSRGRSPREALGELLLGAAQTYAADPRRRGCLVLEHARDTTTSWGSAAARINAVDRAKVLAFLEAAPVTSADRLADFVATTMLGLSACAREGWETARLVAVAEVAIGALDRWLPV